jgi:hypothetical protein
LLATEVFVTNTLCGGNSGLTPDDIIDVFFSSWFAVNRGRTRRNDGEELGIVATVVFAQDTSESYISTAIIVLNDRVDAGALMVNVSVGGEIATFVIGAHIIPSKTVDVDVDAQNDASKSDAQQSVDNENSLSGGAVAGIVLACLAAVLAVGGAVVWHRLEVPASKPADNIKPAHASSHDNGVYATTPVFHAAMSTASSSDPRISRLPVLYGRGLSQANPMFEQVLQFATDTQPARIKSVQYANHHRLGDNLNLKAGELTLGESTSPTVLAEYTFPSSNANASDSAPVWTSRKSLSTFHQTSQGTQFRGGLGSLCHASELGSHRATATSMV